MKTKLIVALLLASSAMFARSRVSIAVGVGGFGVPAVAGYYAPAPAYYPPAPAYVPPVPVAPVYAPPVYAAPYAAPGYRWIAGYWYFSGGHRLWRPGYWGRPHYSYAPRRYGWR